MYEIYLTESRDGQTFRVADLTTVESLDDAQTICVKAQPWLRDGIEAHFASEDSEQAHFYQGSDAGHTAADLAYGQG